jgi:PAS domain-containing protein
MIEGVLVLDEAGRVQFANSTFAEMFNTAGVLRGKTLLEAVRLHEVGDRRTHQRRRPRGGSRTATAWTEPERWLQINAAALTSVAHHRNSASSSFFTT